MPTRDVQSTDLDLALDALAAGRINSPMSLRETGAAAKAEIERLRNALHRIERYPDTRTGIKYTLSTCNRHMASKARKVLDRG